MARNSSGTYSLPQAPFVPGTAIVATPMNNNLNDIASALTLSLPLDGSAPMTGSVKAYDGTPSAPAYSFNSSPGVGFYLNATEGGNAIVITSISVALFTSASATSNYGTYWWYQHTFHGSVDFNGGVIISQGINATTTIQGDLVVTKGMNVGFAGVPVSNQISIGDTNFHWRNDTTLPRVIFDSLDRIRYDRASNEYDFMINDVSIFTVNSVSVGYTSYLRIPEITAPASAAANGVRLYARDNSGTTRIYYKDQNGAEVAMGGPGGWEEITSFAVTASVASIVFSLTKTYSRIYVCGVSISATADSTRLLIVEISDDAGGSYEAADCGGFGGASGGVDDVFTTVSTPMRATALTNAATDLAFFIEFFMCNIAATPKPFGGQAATFTDARGFFGNGQTASCDDIDAIRVRWSTGALIDSGTLTLYGEIAP